MRLEPKAPPLTRNRAAAIFAAPGLLLPVLGVWLVFLAVSGTAWAAEPQPDPAPQAPAVAPDPVPDATNQSPPQQSVPAQPVPVTPQVPEATQQQQPQPAGPATTPSTTTPRQSSSKPKAEPKPERVRRETATSRPERPAKPADPSLLLRVDSFLPGVQGDEDSPSHLVLLAAAALLALLMASGSFLSVATRVWPRQLR